MVSFKENEAAVICYKSKAEVLLAVLTVSNLYRVQFFRLKENVNVTYENDSQSMLSHRRLGHLNFQDLNLLSQPSLIDLRKVHKGFCESCIFGKQHRNTFNINYSKTSFPLDLMPTPILSVVQLYLAVGMKWWRALIYVVPSKTK